MFNQTRTPLGGRGNPRRTAIFVILLGAMNLLELAIPGRRFSWVPVFTAAVLLAAGTVMYRDARRRERLPASTGPWVEEARRSLAAGDKIAAIRVVRQATGLGLADATSLVESWES